MSTDGQTTDNQVVELKEVAAARRGWDIAEVYIDHGISGAKGRDKRPGLDRMLNDAKRRKFDVVMAWAIDRMGRSLRDLVDTLDHLNATGRRPVPRSAEHRHDRARREAALSGHWRLRVNGGRKAGHRGGVTVGHWGCG